MEHNLKHLIYDYLVSHGTSVNTAKYLNMLALLFILIIVVSIIDFVIRKLVKLAFTKLAVRSKTNFDDLLITNKVPRNVAHIIPLLIALEFTPKVFTDFPDSDIIIEKVLQII